MDSENEEELIDPIIKANLWEPLPDLAQITTDSGRWYEFCDSSYGKEKFYSVTTIISASNTEQDKRALNNWKLGQIKEGKDPNQPAADGERMHKLIEEYFKRGYEQPKLADCSGRGYQLYKQYNEGFLSSNYIIPHLIEGRLYTTVDGMSYAGTVDLVATIQSNPEGTKELALIDHKSINKMGNSKSKLKKYLGQLSAYAKAIKDRYGITVDVAYVNFASEKSFKSYRIELDQIMEGWNDFYYTLNSFYKKGVFPSE